MMQTYIMTLIWEDKVAYHKFGSSFHFKDGEKNDTLDNIFAIACEIESYDKKDELPYDYSVDTYENWCFIQSILEQEETKDGAEDSEWGCSPY